MPPLTEQEKTTLVVAVVLRQTNYYVASEVALRARISEPSDQAVEGLMRELGRYELDTPSALLGTKYLVRCLLNGNTSVRETTLRELAQWSPEHAEHRSIIDYVLPQLTDEERKGLPDAKQRKRQ